MKKVLPYLGIILLLIGVLVLTIHYYSDVRTNTYLSVGLGLIVAGVFAHLIIGKLQK